MSEQSQAKTKTWEELEEFLIGVSVAAAQNSVEISDKDRAFALHIAKMWIELTIKAVRKHLPDYVTCRAADRLLQAAKAVQPVRHINRDIAIADELAAAIARATPPEETT